MFGIAAAPDDVLLLPKARPSAWPELRQAKACPTGIDRSPYSTVTVFARLRGWSTSQPRQTASSSSRRPGLQPGQNSDRLKPAPQE